MGPVVLGACVGTRVLICSSDTAQGSRFAYAGFGDSQVGRGMQRVCDK
jgi:hypothetical protein